MKQYILIVFFLPIMLYSRNPFCWDERVQAVDCSAIVPQVESISIDPDGMRLVTLKYNNETFVHEEGERVGQWKIRAIGHNSIVLEGLNGKTYTISLHLDDQ